MAVFADPTRCPDCAASLGVAPRQCPRCGLPLTGPVVTELFTTLTRADELLATLRTLRAAAPAARPAPAPTPAAAAYPAPPRAPLPGPVSAGEPHLGLGTVPRILLGLGALFLLVGAVTFLAMTWSWLGTGGRTAVLLGLTAAAAASSAWLLGRGLRLGAEAHATVACGLGVLDLTGARAAGWLGDLDRAGAAVLVGTLLALTALGVAARPSLAGRRPLVVAQVLVPVGAFTAGAGLLATFVEDAPLAAFLTPVLATLALTFAARAVRLAAVTEVLVATSAVWWLVLLGHGVVELGAPGRPFTYSALVSDDRAVPLLLAALLVPVLPLASAVARHLVPLTVGIAGTLLLALASLPAVDEDPTVPVLVACGVLVACSVGVWAAPSHHWAVAPSVPGIAYGAVVASVGAHLAAAAASAPPRLGSLDAAVTDRLPAVDTGYPAALVVPVLVAAVAFLLAWEQRLRPIDHVAARLVAVAGAATVGALLLAESPLVVPVLVLVALAGVAYGLWWRTDHGAELGVAAGAGLAALWCAQPSDVLLTTVLGLMTAATVAVGLRGGAQADPALALAAVPATATVWTLVHSLGVEAHWSGLVALVVLAPLALLRPVAAVEASVVVCGAVSGLVAFGMHPEPLAWASVLLLAGGAGFAATAALHPHRRQQAVTAGVLVLLALWCQLLHHSADAIEAYTLPLAAVLLGAGVWLMRRNPSLSSWTALGVGLVLATVPSLLTVLAQGSRVGVRDDLLALGCVLLVLAGARWRLAAPLLVGGAVGTVVALLLAGPYAAYVPTFAWLVTAGAVLTVCGVTWEARLQQVRAAGTYLRGLR
jgi:hypothetical protein